MPPQVSPTEKAVSSLMPYVSTTAASSASTWPASSYSAPSTHPPDTLPTASPDRSTAIAAPGGRGELPVTPTTVASPKRCPPAIHALSCSATSRTGDSCPGSAEDHLGQVLVRRQAVPLDEVVDVRQRGRHAARGRA